MEPRVHSQINEYQARQRSSRLWHKIVSALACMVVFCTTYALILPAITMETPQVLACPLEVHTHTEDCYDADGNLVCGKADFVVHVHHDGCYDENGELVCALPEIEVHEHTGECYLEERILICSLEEREEPEAPAETVVHEHGESCYAAERGALICGKDEDEDHEHTDACYEWVPILTCGLEESAGHAHDESCYTEETALLCGLEETAGHEHDASCYTTERGALICENEDEDHEHTDACYEQVAVLSCGLEEGEGAHIHTGDCYGTVKTLTCGLEEGEGAHTHTVDCRLLICGLEEGEFVPVNPDPGEEIPDGDAEAAPTSEKVLDAGDDAEAAPTSEKVLDAEAAPTSEKVLGTGGHVHTDECYEITRTLTCGKEELLVHTHTDDCYDGDGNWICGQLEIVEHVHTDECFVPVEETAPETYAYEDDVIAVEVTLAGGSAVPEGAELVVRPITGMTTFSEDGGGSDYDYEELVRQAEEAVDKAVTEIVLYDISFYTLEGEYLPVADSATVSLRFKEAVLTGDAGEVAVLHYQEEAAVPVTLEDVDVERDEDDSVAILTFRTDGFSVFAVMALADTKAAADNTFTLTYGGYTITFSIVDATGNAISGDYSAYNKTADAKEKYIFSEIAPAIEGYTYSGAKWGTYSVVSVGTSGYFNGFSENNYAFQLYASEPIQSGKWYSRSGNLEVTLTYTDDNAEPTDYTGDWSIVNASKSVAMLSGGLNGDETKNRVGQSVAIIEIDGVEYVTDSTVTVWHFEQKTDETNGSVYYYISTTVDGEKKYLTIGTSSGAPVTLSEEPQEITVTEGTGTYAGMVRLTNSSGRAVNLYSGNADQGFGSYNDGLANEWQTLCKASGGSYLLYDLAVTTTSVGGHVISGTNWEETPELTTAGGEPVPNLIQTVAEESVNLYTPGTPGNDGYFTFVETTRLAIRKQLDNAGKEFRFDGWAATVEGENGSKVEYIFPEGAEATLQEDGIHITDVDGVEQVLSPGTTLTAQWTQVSDIVLFFVNYTGTVLDTEGNVSGRNQKDFTGIIGIGRVYYGKEQAGRDDVFGNDANERIRIKFTNAFNPDDPETQVVMEYVTAYDNTVTTNATASDPQTNGKGYDLYQSAVGINDTELETALLNFIQKNDNVTIKVSTADNANNPEIENENSTPDNYSVRWYVMKEQSDAWHIDGVMVAKTQEVTVTKTFSGLTDAQVKTLLQESSGDGFRMPVKLGEKRSDYITMTTQGIDGQYAYYGQEKTGGQSYTWILNAITDEQYTLSEENYELEGYDVSAMVVHYYTDENGETQISYQAGDTTEGLSQEMFGGKTTAVSFNNFYTRKGTGAFAIHKSSSASTGENDVGSALQGAEFTLYSDAACTTVMATSTTNSRGSAYFDDLEPGVYYMKETQAPDGYLDDTKSVWKVDVVKAGTETVDGTTRETIKVTVYRQTDSNGNPVTNDNGVVCYDDGIQASYPIQNTPESGAVRVTKTFEGLTAAQMEAIVRGSSETGGGYCIKLQGDIGGNGTINANLGTTATLYLQDAARSQDGYTFTWMITNLAMQNSNGTSISYTISEYNYMTADYIDTVVTAVVNGVTQTDNKIIDRDEDDPTDTIAMITNVTFAPDQSDTVVLNNRYTNTFNLSLQKVDSVTGAALAGARFDIYGRYRDSTDTTKRITYTDPVTGRTTTYYYITFITSGADGVATGYDLNLSDGSIAFVYVLDESSAPDGYRPGTPQVITVNVFSDDYKDGVYSIRAPNTKEQDYVHTALNTEKVWQPYVPAGATVTLELYRVTHDERDKPLDNVVGAERVATVTLDGTVDNKPTIVSDSSPPTAYESAPWTATWMNLYSASAGYSQENPEHYHYFVREVVAINGFTTTYTCCDVDGVTPDGAFQTLRVTNGEGNTEIFQSILLADMDEAYTVTITNTAYFELPETGGSGTLSYAIGGALLMAGCLLYGYKLRRKWERRSAR